MFGRRIHTQRVTAFAGGLVAIVALSYLGLNCIRAFRMHHWLSEIEDGSLTWRQRASAADRLIQVGRPAAPGLLKVLRASDPLSRKLAMMSLAVIGPRSGLRAIVEHFCGETDASVRAYAVMAVRRIGPGYAEIESFARRALADPAPSVRGSGICLVYSIEDMDLDLKRKEIGVLLSDPSPGVRRVAADYLELLDYQSDKSRKWYSCGIPGT